MEIVVACLQTPVASRSTWAGWGPPALGCHLYFCSFKHEGTQSFELSIPHLHVGGSETKTMGLLTRRCGKGHPGLKEEVELGPDMPELIAGKM